MIISWCAVTELWIVLAPLGIRSDTEIPEHHHALFMTELNDLRQKVMLQAWLLRDVAVFVPGITIT